MLKILTHWKKNVHVNNAIHSWTVQVNCNVHCFLNKQCKSIALFTWTIYTIHANYTVKWIV